MIKTTFLSICFFLFNAPALAQHVIDNCILQPYTGCPEINLNRASLRGINLQGAYLKNADLQNANLTNANFIDACLYGANLTGANFTGADFSKTIWPDGRTCGFNSIGTCR